MKNLLTALVLFVTACSSAPDTESPSFVLRQIDSANCKTELATGATECDVDRPVVMHCASPNAKPSEQCSAGHDGSPFGLVWCCEKSFTETCVTLGLCK